MQFRARPYQPWSTAIASLPIPAIHSSIFVIVSSFYLGWLAWAGLDVKAINHLSPHQTFASPIPACGVPDTLRDHPPPAQMLNPVQPTAVVMAKMQKISPPYAATQRHQNRLLLFLDPLPSESFYLNKMSPIKRKAGNLHGSMPKSCWDRRLPSESLAWQVVGNHPAPIGPLGHHHYWYFIPLVRLVVNEGWGSMSTRLLFTR